MEIVFGGVGRTQDYEGTLELFFSWSGSFSAAIASGRTADAKLAVVSVASLRRRV